MRVIESMWKDKFEWIRSELEDVGGDKGKTMHVFPLVLHPDTSGMAHVIGMVERVVKWLQEWDGDVEFCTYESVASEWKEMNKVE